METKINQIYSGSPNIYKIINNKNTSDLQSGHLELTINHDLTHAE